MRRLNFFIEDDQREWLADTAAAYGVGVSEYLRVLINEKRGDGGAMEDFRKSIDRLVDELGVRIDRLEAVAERYGRSATAGDNEGNE